MGKHHIQCVFDSIHHRDHARALGSDNPSSRSLAGYMGDLEIVDAAHRRHRR